MNREQRSNVTPEQFGSWCVAAMQRHPNRTNPVNLTGTCCYTDPDDTSCHCIIGEVLAEHDPDALPGVESADNVEAAGELLDRLGYSPDVCTVAGYWQAAGDTGEEWGVLVAELA